MFFDAPSGFVGLKQLRSLAFSSSPTQLHNLTQLIPTDLVSV